jgi:hypothetical protein
MVRAFAKMGVMSSCLNSERHLQQDGCMTAYMNRATPLKGQSKNNTK